MKITKLTEGDAALPPQIMTDIKSYVDANPRIMERFQDFVTDVLNVDVGGARAASNQATTVATAKMAELGLTEESPEYAAAFDAAFDVAFEEAIDAAPTERSPLEDAVLDCFFNCLREQW